MLTSRYLMSTNLLKVKSGVRLLSSTQNPLERVKTNKRYVESLNTGNVQFSWKDSFAKVKGDKSKRSRWFFWHRIRRFKDVPRKKHKFWKKYKPNVFLFLLYSHLLPQRTKEEYLVNFHTIKDSKSVSRRFGKRNFSKNLFLMKFFFKGYYLKRSWKSWKRTNKKVLRSLKDFETVIEAQLGILLQRLKFAPTAADSWRLIKEGSVFVNNKVCKDFNYRVQPQDTIWLKPPLIDLLRKGAIRKNFLHLKKTRFFKGYLKRNSLKYLVLRRNAFYLNKLIGKWNNTTFENKGSIATSLKGANYISKDLLTPQSKTSSNLLFLQRSPMISLKPYLRFGLPNTFKDVKLSLEGTNKVLRLVDDLKFLKKNPYSVVKSSSLSVKSFYSTSTSKPPSKDKLTKNKRSKPSWKKGKNPKFKKPSLTNQQRSNPIKVKGKGKSFKDKDKASFNRIELKVKKAQRPQFNRNKSKKVIPVVKKKIEKPLLSFKIHKVNRGVKSHPLNRNVPIWNKKELLKWQARGGLRGKEPVRKERKWFPGHIWWKIKQKRRARHIAWVNSTPKSKLIQSLFERVVIRKKVGKIIWRNKWTSLYTDLSYFPTRRKLALFKPASSLRHHKFLLHYLQSLRFYRWKKRYSYKHLHVNYRLFKATYLKDPLYYSNNLKVSNFVNQRKLFLTRLYTNKKFII